MIYNKYNIYPTQSEDFLFFYGHGQPKDNVMTKSCLSQWWLCLFMEDSIVFHCAEQYMMYHKALLFEDGAIAAEILKCSDPKKIKALGRKVKNFDGQIWDEHKEQIVQNGNLLKFSQNSELKEFLLSTDEKILVEASPFDKVWGIGMKESDPLINDVNQWKGSNLLGFALMEVRDRLK